MGEGLNESLNLKNKIKFKKQTFSVMKCYTCSQVGSSSNFREVSK